MPCSQVVRTDSIYTEIKLRKQNKIYEHRQSLIQEREEEEQEEEEERLLSRSRHFQCCWR